LSVWQSLQALDAPKVWAGNTEGVIVARIDQLNQRREAEAALYFSG
jgi:hypothetical protein